MKIIASTRKGVLANDVLTEVVPQLEALEMPQGHYYKLPGEAGSEGDAFGRRFVAVILLTVFLFIAVLVFQFKTFKGILIVLPVIPLGIFGGASLLWLTGNPTSS